MTDQPSSQPTTDSAHPTLAEGSAIGPTLPRFQPLPPTEPLDDEAPDLIDDEPSPFISDRIKSGHLGKSEVPKDIWIWATVAIVLLGLAIFGLVRRPSEVPSNVQIVEPQSE
ncbi:MAG: hypothetical protein WA947_00655 [Phormidesmis sp.]